MVLHDVNAKAMNGAISHAYLDNENILCVCNNDEYTSETSGR